MANKRLRAFGRGVLCLIFWLLVWQGGAMLLSRALVLPTPWAVAVRLSELVFQRSFLITCLSSLGRIFLGLVFGTAVGILLAAACAASHVLDSLFSPLISVIKATPVASVIIVMLFVLGKGVVPMIAALLMVIPIVFVNVRRGILAVPKEEREVASVYGFGPGKRMRYCILPSVLPYFSAACRSALGLAWKAGIAAEVICTPANSIGGKLYDAKIYLESEDLFAWTIVVILLSVLIERGLVSLLERLTEKGGRTDAET